MLSMNDQNDRRRSSGVKSCQAISKETRLQHQMVRVLFITLNVFENLNEDYVILRPKFEEGDKLKAIAIIFERMTEGIIQNFIQKR